MKKFYTIFLGDSLWEDIVDDMRTTEIWGMGGKVWTSKKKAEACIKDLRHPVYALENDGKKFKVVELKQK